ncbi:MAG: PAS domain S-box protein [Opitutales bacterium]
MKPRTPWPQHIPSGAPSVTPAVDAALAEVLNGNAGSLLGTCAAQVWQLDGNACIRGCNETAMVSSGFSRDALLEKSFDQLPALIDGAALHEANVQVAVSGQPLLDQEGRLFGGTNARPWRLDRLPLFDNEGQPNGLLLIAHDTVGSIEARRLLEEKEHRLEMALLGAEIGTFDWEVDTDLVHLDPQVAPILGLDPKAGPISRQSFDRFFDDESLHRLRERFYEHALGRADCIETELSGHNPQGRPYWLRLRARIVQRGHRDGQAVRVSGILQNVTQTRSAQQRLVLLQEAVEHGPSSVFITDSAGRFDYVNEKFCEATGYEPEEIVGRSPLILDAGTQDSAIYERLWKALQQGRTWNGELHRRRKDGSLFWEHVSICPIKDEQGRITHFVGTAKDITERKAREARMAEATRSAESANREKTQFLVNISHEIRTPLNGILGMTELLGESPLRPEQRKFLRSIQYSGQALLSLINDLLDLSKIEAGMMEFVEQRFDLSRMASEVCGLLATNLSSEEVDIVVRFAPDAPRWVLGDPLKLRQILVNLVGNAVKFTKHGHIVLEIACEDCNQQRGNFTFRVQDTGIGIDKAFLPRLFEKFTQVDPSLTRAGSGTGLGLSITREYVRRMGGDLTVQSERGAGSTFAFTLSLPYDTEARVELEAPPSLRGRSLLLIDRCEPETDALRQVADWLGLVLIPVSSFDQAHQALRQRPKLDAVAVDARCLENGGAEHFQELLDLPALAHAECFLLDRLGTRSGTHVPGLHWDGVLTRPVTAEAFVLTLAPETREKAACGETKGLPGVTPSPRSPGQRPRFKARVLLAEDNAINRETATRMLEIHGCEVVTAVNGAQAARQALANDFDLIFMDVQMPEVDGFMATRLIRESANGRHPPPIIAMTANAMLGYERVCREAGMADYVAKPITLDCVGDCLERHLGHNRKILVEPPVTDHGLDLDPSAPQTGAGDRNLPFSPQILHDVSGGEADTLRHLLVTLLDSYRDDLQSIEKAWRAGDLDGLSKGAHRLHGTALNIGAPRLQEQARRLEAAARGNLESVYPLWPEFSSVAHQTLRSIETYPWQPKHSASG